MYGWDILCGISKGTFEIPHKISCPYIEWYVVCGEVKIQELPDLQPLWQPHYVINMGQCFHWNTYIDTLRPRQNGHHFAVNILKYIFLNENVWISIKISMQFVPKDPINNIPAMVQIMVWHGSGDKPLSEPMMTLFTDSFFFPFQE